MKLKIVKIIVLSIIIICTCSVNSFALQVKDGAGGGKSEEKDYDITQKIDPGSWKPDNPDQNSEAFNQKVGKLLGALQNFGIVASVISLMIIGLRTMYGSLEDKSHYKELLPTFLIGVFILLACTTIPNIIYQVASKFNDI